MITIKEKKNCCGCNACGDVCLQGAVSFKADNEGFWYPEFDPIKCVNCGMCKKVCPIINASFLKKNDLDPPVCYAAEHKNLEVIFDSTSGGLFTALAEKMYGDNGFVGGAIFNDDFSVSHYFSNKAKDLLKIRNSKYLQSDLSGFYRKVKELVDNNERALVCGCPCQMAALRSYLVKDYDNLIIVDFACYGINSPKVWQKYIKSFEERYGSPVVYTKAKSKEFGWRNLTQKIILSNGKTYYETKDDCNFVIGYVKANVYCRPSCYECQFKDFPRISDITLADFWGIEKYNTSMEKNLGTSLVIINSQKGKSYFEQIAQNINYFQTPFEVMLPGNQSLIKSLTLPTIDRKQFFDDLEIMSFIEIAEKYFKKPETYKTRIKFFLRIGYTILKDTRLHIIPLLQTLRFNRSFASFWYRKVLIPSPYCIFDINKTAKITVDGIFRLGVPMIKKSKLETRLWLQDKADLKINGDVRISYGADIEIFKNGKLTIGKNTFSNINLTIICMEQIDIGERVGIGRNVTIRDNNGYHYLNRNNYKPSRPILIENNVWLASGCTIMPGVHIGEGAIVGANSVVIIDVPAHAMVLGNPARIVDKNVLKL
jgi:acetyltransferase-like isoleucine patch superfamily enzyme/coenzyme F420-reducing hydrogenase beta subunit